MLGLVLPADCFVCDRTAAWIHAGDRALAPNEHLDVPPISCFRPSDAGRLRNGLSASGERAIRAARPDGDRRHRRHDAAAHGARPRTPPARRPTSSCTAWTRCSAWGSSRTQQLLAEIPRFNRQRGVVELRVLGPLADGGSESFGETALRRRWHGAGLPRPKTQISVSVDGREVYRLDLGLEELCFAAEYDGEQWHGEEAGAPRRGASSVARPRTRLVDRGLPQAARLRDRSRMPSACSGSAYDAARARRGLPRTYFLLGVSSAPTRGSLCADSRVTLRRLGG